MSKTVVRVATILFSGLFAVNALAQDVSGDPAKGKKAFKKCSACHVADEPKNKIGPHLVGIIGRPAGTVEDYKYSKGLIVVADEGLVWTPEAIAEYLKKPSSMIEGTKMTFAGLRKDEEIANILAYLAQFETQ